MINCQVSKLLASEFIERQYSEPKDEIVSSNPPVLRISVDHFSIISEHLQWIWRTQILALFCPIAGSNTDVSKIKTEGYWINVPYDWLGNHDYGVDDKLRRCQCTCLSAAEILVMSDQDHLSFVSPELNPQLIEALPIKNMISMPAVKV
ncbi:uncharacterized protein RAG0_04668 [Rhynchosporium agropyri]|uniref:Uncharacterized protein n=1 Tax=Rhynchosporium agropyri TaxID=914238 RepID=A0A1E1KDL5_9HELO|nr:uncharacterized protein RAG0_04668 [Rhynchosporium agropyri]